jgi:hypothetical protein
MLGRQCADGIRSRVIHSLHDLTVAILRLVRQAGAEVIAAACCWPHSTEVTRLHALFDASGNSGSRGDLRHLGRPARIRRSHARGHHGRLERRQAQRKATLAELAKIDRAKLRRPSR